MAGTEATFKNAPKKSLPSTFARYWLFFWILKAIGLLAGFLEKNLIGFSLSQNYPIVSEDIEVWKLFYLD